MDDIYDGLILFPNKKPLNFGASVLTKGKKQRERIKKFGFSSLTGKRKMKGLQEKFANAKTRATLRSRTINGRENFKGTRSFYNRSMDIRRDMNRCGRPLSSQVLILNKRTLVKKFKIFRNLKN